MNTLLRSAIGFAIGLTLGGFAFVAASLPARSLAPLNGALTLPTPRVGVDVTLSFVETGTANVPGFLLAQGLGLSPRPVTFRAAIIEHPLGLIVFGAGVSPSASDEHVPWRVRNPFGAVTDERELAVEIAELGAPHQVILPTARWYHVGGAAAFDRQTVWVGSSEIWAATAGSWPYRFGYIDSQVDALAPQRRGTSGPRFLGSRGSHDIFGDGTLVLLSYRGASVEELMLLVSVAGERQVLLVGESAWAHEQVSARLPRALAATWFTDRSRARAAHTLRILSLAESDYGVRVIPLLDGTLELPVFPESW
ncbi:MAG: N-acyl homoserine lactone hydrolase [Flavobacteriales bacterium]|jgi:N-acyl homoserine lactone hydrolase